jgi:hypothetical protein
MKKYIEFIKEVYKKPKGKAILFFMGYLIFFIFLMILVRVVTPKPVTYEDYEKGNAYDYSIENLLSDNYSYTYTIKCGNDKYEYNGKKDGKNEIFTFNGVDYYKNSDGFFNNKSGSFVKGDNPFKYYYFIEFDNINDLFTNSYYLSKTEFDDKRQKYDFLISTNTIIKLMEDKDIDISDEANTLVLNTDKDGYVNKLEFTLDSFATYKKECSNNLKIVLEYSNYGEIENIKSPIN